MKKVKKKLIAFVFTLSFGVVFVFCSVSEIYAQQGLVNENNNSVSESFFDSLDKGNELIICEDDFKKIKHEQKDSTISESGFQVQFFATSNKDIAKKEKERIEETMGVSVIVVHENDYYKLRSLLFKTRREAEMFKDKMKNIGHNAWIVAVNN